ncbi:MAG: hypothetical protein EAZ89_19410 [Bacteroidetes bacterium]|nr:MAG: hypothetical protein EAZ89_19410 [Bacteroidota bacterium]
MRYLLLLVMCLPGLLPGQMLRHYQEVAVSEGGQVLTSPWAGGFNTPQFSATDLNGDGENDLVVFDRTGAVFSVFLRDTLTGQLVYAHSYRSLFPAEAESWALLRDVNCDGKADIFTSNEGQNSVRLYLHSGTATQPAYSLSGPALTTPTGPVYTAAADLPDVVDVDNDGDLDYLAFDASGSHVVWYKNIAAACDTPSFMKEDNCWGDFTESGISNEVTLNTPCKRSETGPPGHAGSTVCAFDNDSDNDKELLLGDLNADVLVYLLNGGSAASAQMTQVVTGFPDYDTPAQVEQFLGAFYVDVNEDGDKDLLTAPNANNISQNIDNVWYYENLGQGGISYFALQQEDFLGSEMIDCGEDSQPVFFDYNGDGLMDIVAGNQLYKHPLYPESGTLTLYKNTGTATAPAFELITRDYLGISGLFNPALTAIRPAFGDIDADGDADMLLGDRSGTLHFFRNTAASGQPPSLQLESAGYQGIDVGDAATPQIVDLNRDGLPDLLIGEKAGNLNYYANQGSAANPVFVLQSATFGGVDVYVPCCTGYSVPWVYENAAQEYELLVGAESGEVFHYTQVEGNLNGTFTLTTTSFGSIKEGLRAAPAAADLDGDGRLEWACGNRRGGIGLYTTHTSAPVGEEKQPPALPFRVLQTAGRTEIVFIRPELLPATAELYAMDGRRVFQGEISLDNTLIINQSAFAPGIYVLRADDRNGQTWYLKIALTSGN